MRLLERKQADSTKRYQVQMFLVMNIQSLTAAQNLLMQAGNMLASDNIRYYIKHLFMKY